MLLPVLREIMFSFLVVFPFVRKAGCQVWGDFADRKQREVHAAVVEGDAAEHE